MKFKVGDKVLITAGKDKGKVEKISKVLPNENKVVVPGVGKYVKHVKPMPMINRPGEKVTLYRPIPVANIAIINDKGMPDRIGYKVDKQGTKIRVFKKTGLEVPEPTSEAAVASKDTKQEDKKAKETKGKKTNSKELKQ